MKKHLLIYLLFLVFTPLVAQPAIQWQKCLGGNYLETAYSSQLTTDGGLIVAGTSFSFNTGQVFGAHGGGDFWVVKLDSTGNIEWQKPLGGSSAEIAYSIILTAEGGYLVSGTTSSNNGDVTGYHGGQDAWVAKLDQMGQIEWQIALGGSSMDGAKSAWQTTDGAYIVAGSTNSTDGDAQSNGYSYNNAWVIKLSTTGEIQWEKKFGGNGAEEARSIQQTLDGGYIFAGITSSNDGDVTNNNGNDDFWVVKIDSIGNIEWQKALGGAGADDGRNVIQTKDGGFIVTGDAAGTGSTGQVTGLHGLFDVWVVKLSKSGTIEWQKALGGSMVDVGHSTIETKDKSYIVTGTTQSSNGDVQLNQFPGPAGWIVKLGISGNKIWQKPIGGTESERLYSVHQSADNGLLLTGETESNDGDVSGNHGVTDFWIVKLAPESSPTSTPPAYPIQIYPNPAQQSITLNLPTTATSLSVCISDVLGRSMLRQTGMVVEAGSILLEVSALPAGVYLVSAVDSDGQLYTGRFLKE